MTGPPTFDEQLQGHRQRIGAAVGEHDAPAGDDGADLGDVVGQDLVGLGPVVDQLDGQWGEA